MALETLEKHGIGLGQVAQPRYENWIPVSESLPEEIVPVNITWINRAPPPYHAGIKDKPFTATGIYHNEEWYWYSSVCEDYLKEYGHFEVDLMDSTIEVIAWMPLPEPYDGEDNELEMCCRTCTYYNDEYRYCTDAEVESDPQDCCGDWAEPPEREEK